MWSFMLLDWNSLLRTVRIKAKSKMLAVLKRELLFISQWSQHCAPCTMFFEHTVSFKPRTPPSVSAYSVINSGETEILVRTGWAYFIWAYNLLFLMLGFCGQSFFLVRFARNLSTLLFFSKTQFLGSFIYPSRFLFLYLHFFVL